MAKELAVIDVRDFADINILSICCVRASEFVSDVLGDFSTDSMLSIMFIEMHTVGAAVAVADCDVSLNMSDDLVSWLNFSFSIIRTANCLFRKLSCSHVCK